MSNDIDITVFKEFARLEDPYECALYEAKQNDIQPFKKQAYVGRIDPANADNPVGPKPSSNFFLSTAEAPYPLLRTVICQRPLETIEEEKPPLSGPETTTSLKPVQSEMRVRSVLDNHGKWEAYLTQHKTEKAARMDAADPRVPQCLRWTTEEVLAWLYGIKMEKYEATFLANVVDGTRLCDLDLNRLVKLGVHSWDDLTTISKEIKILTKIPARPWFYLRDTSRPPMDDIDLYLEFKNVHGVQSETTSFSQFTEENYNTLWSYPEKTLRYPGMIYQSDHTKRITTDTPFYRPAGKLPDQEETAASLAEEAALRKHYAELDDQLYYLGLRIRSVEGDGNCFFRAVSDQISGTCDSHGVYRKNTADYMINHQDIFKDFIVTDDYEDYVTTLSQDGIYVDNDTILAFARMMGITVVIHQLNQQPILIPGNDDPLAPESHITYVPQHYNSLRWYEEDLDTRSPADIRCIDFHTPSVVPRLRSSTNASTST